MSHPFAFLVFMFIKLANFQRKVCVNHFILFGRDLLIICYKLVSRCIMVEHLGPVYFFKFTKKAIHFISCEFL